MPPLKRRPSAPTTRSGWVRHLPLPYDTLLLPGEAPDGALGPRTQTVRAETTCLGHYEVIDGEFSAIPGSTKEEVVWTFVHGIDPEGVPGRIDGGEGWEEIDAAAQDGIFFRAIDDSLDLGGAPPPIISGEHSLRVGMDAPGVLPAEAERTRAWRRDVIKEAQS